MSNLFGKFKDWFNNWDGPLTLEEKEKLYNVEVSACIEALTPEYNELISLQMGGAVLSHDRREAMDRFERMFGIVHREKCCNGKKLHCKK